MVSGFEITCANKNAQGVIVRIGGEGWSLSTHEAVVKLVCEELRLYIQNHSETFTIGVRGEDTDAYLVLEPGGEPLHELEELPSC